MWEKVYTVVREMPMSVMAPVILLFTTGAVIQVVKDQELFKGD